MDVYRQHLRAAEVQQRVAATSTAATMTAAARFGHPQQPTHACGGHSAEMLMMPQLMAAQYGPHGIFYHHHYQQLLPFMPPAMTMNTMAPYSCPPHVMMPPPQATMMAAHHEPRGFSSPALRCCTEQQVYMPQQRAAAAATARGAGTIAFEPQPQHVSRRLPVGLL